MEERVEMQTGAAKVRIDRITNLYMVTLLERVSAEVEVGENVTELVCGFIGDGVQVPGEERF
jgi:hypothetical protein